MFNLWRHFVECFRSIIATVGKFNSFFVIQLKISRVIALNLSHIDKIMITLLDLFRFGNSYKTLHVNK